MRLVAVLAVALLLTSCTWVRNQWEPAPVGAPPATAPTPKPEVKPHRPHAAERPVTAPVATPAAASPAETPPDYSARCHAMAENRADDAKQLGASPADQTQMQADTYRDCMAQSVK
jgi:hypothetical protein